MDSPGPEESENFESLSKNECNNTNNNTPTNISATNSNIVYKLFNREIYGCTSRRSNDRSRKMFEKIPPRLRFCLMDIVPITYLREHVFMGFSQCGQFLLSFTYSCTTQAYFRESSKFTLHFLSWVPGCVVRPVHSVPLFGDDVDSKVTISMAQWKHNPGVLVVYGIADSCSERSYLSVIGVPRLGCKKCIALSREEDDLSWGKRCLEHNFAIHTKFFCTSDSSMYEPVVQLAYSNQIIIYTDFIHILEIDFVKPDQDRSETDDGKFLLDRDETNSMDTSPSTPASDVSAAFQSPKYQNNAVQNILADFSDMDVEPYQMSRPVHLSDMTGQELCIQASSISHNLVEEWEGPSPSIRTLISPPLRSPRRRPAESMSRFNETHRIIAEKAYEFVEEAETKCEKLSMFRKRRLADKKYEFSEDNNENIVPFRVLRSNRKYFTGSTSKAQPRRPKSPPVESVVLRAHNQIGRPPSLDADRNSEAEYRVTEMLDDGSMKTISVHDNTSKTLSDCDVSPQDPYLVHSGNSKCSKFFTRYFVESDDEITSIITDSEGEWRRLHVGLPRGAAAGGARRGLRGAAGRGRGGVGPAARLRGAGPHGARAPALAGHGAAVQRGVRPAVPAGRQALRLLLRLGLPRHRRVPLQRLPLRAVRDVAVGERGGRRGRGRRVRGVRRRRQRLSAAPPPVRRRVPVRVGPGDRRLPHGARLHDRGRQPGGFPSGGRGAGARAGQEAGPHQHAARQREQAAHHTHRAITEKTDGRGELHRDHQEPLGQLRVRVLVGGGQRLRVLRLTSRSLLERVSETHVATCRYVIVFTVRTGRRRLGPRASARDARGRAVTHACVRVEFV